MQYANPKLQLNCYLFVGLQLISLGSTSARVRPTPHCFGPAVVNMQREVYLIYRVLSSINCRGHWRDTKSKRHIFWRGNTWDSRHYVISFCGLYLKCDHKLTFHLTELIVFFLMGWCNSHLWFSSHNWYVSMSSCSLLSSVSMVTNLSHTKVCQVP